MRIRSLITTCCTWLCIALGGPSTVSGDEVLVTADANISTLVTDDDTVLRWTGNHTVTVDASGANTVAGIDAAGFTATIDFQNANRKIILGNSDGNVVIQAGAGQISVQGAGTGARSAGFLVSPSLDDQIIEVQTTIDDADNANYWIIGDHTLRLNGTSPELGDVDIGADASSASINCDKTATIDLITPTGDFEIDVASSTTFTITQTLAVEDDTVTITGASSTSEIEATGGISLDDADSVLGVTGTITLDDLDLGTTTEAAINLADGASLTLTDEVTLGARTLTLNGTTGSSAETITATGGLSLSNASSLLVIDGDSSNTLVVSNVHTDADNNAGEGVDINENAKITTFTVTHSTDLDVASGKTLTGNVVLNAAETLDLTGKGTVSKITANTAAGTIQFSDSTTVTTLNSNVDGTTIDVDESATISALVVNNDTEIDVANGSTLTTQATVEADTVLTASNTGTMTLVVLDGEDAELNITGGGKLTTLRVDTDGGILDIDGADCTITSCTLSAGSGDLIVENAARRITTSSGFDVNDNTLAIIETGGTIDLVTLDTENGTLDINNDTTVTELSVEDDTIVNVSFGTTLTTSATVSAGANMIADETGTISKVMLDGGFAELNVANGGTVSSLLIQNDGGILDIDDDTTVTSITMDQGQGDLTIDVQSGAVLSGDIDVNDNQLSLVGTGRVGNITMNRANGVLNVDADTAASSVTVAASAAIDIAASTELDATIDIGAFPLTLKGSGSLSRIEATTGTITANGTTTIDTLRATYGSGDTFTYTGTGNSTVTNLTDATAAANSRFRKSGSGTLTIENGLADFFLTATGMTLDIDGGQIQIGTEDAPADISFDNDEDEITIAGGAALTTFGSIEVTDGGTNVNIEADDNATVYLSSTSDSAEISAASDNDFTFGGTLIVDGVGGAYSLIGAHTFLFGSINIAAGAELANIEEESRMEFFPDSTINLEGSGSTGGTLTVDGQTNASRIIMTTTEDGAFTIDKNGSDNLTINYVELSNARYRSDAGRAAVDEVTLLGTTDAGDNTNWFSAAIVEDDDDQSEIEDGDFEDELPDEDIEVEEDVELYTGGTVSVGRSGTALTGAASENSGASATVEVFDASSGALRVTLADGQIINTLEGIPDELALPVSLRVTSSISEGFSAVVQLCYTRKILTESGLDESELVMYVFEEPDGPWVLAGESGKYHECSEPTDQVGDYGTDCDANCIWVVRDEFSDFTAGSGPTDSSRVTETISTQDPTTTLPVCGLLGFVPWMLMSLGIGGLKWTRAASSYGTQ